MKYLENKYIVIFKKFQAMASAEVYYEAEKVCVESSVGWDDLLVCVYKNVFFNSHPQQCFTPPPYHTVA